MAGRQRGRVKPPSRLTREILIAYPHGLFPMSISADDPSYQWYGPEFRGIIPLNGFHASKSLRRFAKANQSRLSFHLNADFEAVMRRCALREETWISEVIKTAFCELNELGLAHALTVNLDDQNLGGVYGLSLGKAFFAESMYSNGTNGSKLALWALTTHLHDLGYALFDTQYLTPHLASLGGEEIHADAYQKLLNAALPELLSDDFRELALVASWGQLQTFFRNRCPLISAPFDPNIITRMIHG